MRKNPTVAIRDYYDHDPRSISQLQRNFVTQLAYLGAVSSHQGEETDHVVARTAWRSDGRSWDQIRTPHITWTRPPPVTSSSSSSSSSFLQTTPTTTTATVQWGPGTRVTATVQAVPIPPPYPDRPLEGVLALAVDFVPAALALGALSNTGSVISTASVSNLSLMEPDHRRSAMKILKYLEHVLLTDGSLSAAGAGGGGALDTEALVLVPEQWVWRIQCTVTVLAGTAGNVGDASVLAALAALRHARLPAVKIHSTTTTRNMAATEKEKPASTWLELIPWHVQEPTLLPMQRTPLLFSAALLAHTPSSSSSSVPQQTSRLLSVVALMDPTWTEECVCQGSVATVAMNMHGELCGLWLPPPGGGAPGVERVGGGVSAAWIRRIWLPTVRRAAQELGRQLEQALMQAHEQDVQDRIRFWSSLSSSSLSLPEDRLPTSSSSNNMGGSTTTTTTQRSWDVMQGSTLKMTTQDQTWQQMDQAVEAAMETDPSQKRDDKKDADDEDEAYRLRALDYNVAHIPSVLAADETTPQGLRSRARPSQEILRSLLLSVQQQEELLQNTPRQQPPAPPPTSMPAGTSRSRAIESAMAPISADRHADLPTQKVQYHDDDDDDDEEVDTTMAWQSEFSSLPSAPKDKDSAEFEKPSTSFHEESLQSPDPPTLPVTGATPASTSTVSEEPMPPSKTTPAAEDGDADDLSAAIVKKKATKKPIKSKKR